MRIATTITLNEADREVLQRWARGRSTPARLVQRAKIVLRAAEPDMIWKIGSKRSSWSSQRGRRRKN